MASSRTGTNRTSTGKWKKLRSQVRQEAQSNGLTQCPICHVHLDWNSAQKPRSVEVDHKIPVASGGTDDRDNLWAICRLCNGRKGSAQGRKKGQIARVAVTPFVNPRW